MDIPTIPLKGFSVFLAMFAGLCLVLAASFPSASIHFIVLVVITLGLMGVLSTLT
jgi:hypothetical protein